jgi:hypothetical protein
MTAAKINSPAASISSEEFLLVRAPGDVLRLSLRSSDKDMANACGRNRTRGESSGRSNIPELIADGKLNRIRPVTLCLTLAVYDYNKADQDIAQAAE